VFAFTRTYQEETLLVVVNLSKFPQPAEIDLSEYKGYSLIEVVSRNKFPKVKEDGYYFFTLAAYAFHWFALEKAEEEIQSAATLPYLAVDELADLQQPKNIEKLETEILPSYLPKTKWFNGLYKTLYSLKINNHEIISFSENPVYWILLDAVYQSGLPETYQLPLRFVTEKKGEKIRQVNPDALVAVMECGKKKGFLCDAFFTVSLQQDLINHMVGQQEVPLRLGKIDFYGNDLLKEYKKESEEVRTRIHTSDELNTSITYDNRFFLRMYRKIDISINPDLEITRFLSEKAKFRYMPRFIGAIEWKYDQKAIVLGIMQTMIENHGNGYTYMRERVNNFIERILAREKHQVNACELIGSLTNPVGFDQLPEHLQELIGTHAA
jgi:maltose alpha-D-glucosyltransferase/alpha-amylase